MSSFRSKLRLALGLGSSSLRAPVRIVVVTLVFGGLGLLGGIEGGTEVGRATWLSGSVRLSILS